MKIPKSDIQKSDTQTLIAYSGLFFFILPGLVVLLLNLFSSLGSINLNPFFFLLIFGLGSIPAIVGIITCLIAEKVWKRKIILFLSGMIFYILLFPAIWGISSIKLQVFLLIHNNEFEMIAQDLLNEKTDIETANQKLKQESYLVKVICVPKENKHVLFMIDGMIDNAHGFSYSIVNFQPTDNCCGDFTSWKRIRKHWYKWVTT